uniref:Uncharacterized protein n=1 Tax=Anopheles culicifacies TaxID=139723 RepID=A0A182M5F7_9DIPT
MEDESVPVGAQIKGHSLLLWSYDFGHLVAHGFFGTPPVDMQRNALCVGEPTTMIRTVREHFDLLDELELLLHRKGRLSVVLVTFIALAVCFLVVGLLMATGIMLVTFFIFICYNETPNSDETGHLNALSDG